MGFIMEEEYLARRAALGAPPPETTTEAPISTPVEPEVSPYSVPEPAYDPYNTSYNYNPPEVTPVVEDNIVSYQPPTYDSPTYPPTDSYNPPQWTPQDDPYYTTSVEVASLNISIEATPTSQETSSFAGASVSSANNGFNNEFVLNAPSHSHFPTPNASGEAAVVGTRVGEDITNLSHVFTKPHPDESSVSLLSRPIPYGKCLLVHRTAVTYEVHEVEPNTSIWIALNQAGISDSSTEVFKAGTSEVSRDAEMYWHTTSWKEAPKVSALEAGNVYVTRPKKNDSFYESGSVIDERVIWRYNISKLEPASSMGRIDNDIFEYSHVIPGLRTMSGSWGYYDPREVVKHFAKYLKATEGITSAYNPRSGKFSLKTKPTPAFLLWPMLVHLLRSLEAKVESKYTINLPEDSKNIWARVNECASKNICYFTGKPAAYGSFLSEDIDTKEATKLYEQIKAEGCQPTGEVAVSNPAGRATLERLLLTDYSTKPAEEKGTYRWEYDDDIIKYEATDMKMSYGWPTEEDTTGTSTKTLVPDTKPIRGARSELIKDLVRGLASQRGPKFDVDPRL